MNEVGKVPQLIFKFGNIQFTLNYLTLIWSWVVMAILIFIAFRIKKNAKLVPTDRVVLFFEWLIEAFVDIMRETLTEKFWKKYFGFIMTIFLFVALSNMISIVPIPNIKCPTEDLNTTLGLGLLVFLTVHFSAIYYKGFWTYLKEFFEPYAILAPLNFVGEIAKVVSHSFRLFGNILGGGIIILVISELIKYILLPVFLNAFFGIFVGIVQAFVFTMLAIVYLAVAIVED